LTPSRDLVRLLEIMAALRDPETGCPWDLEQTLASIAPYTLEEAYEVADAVERNDLAGLKDELGDLLLQVVFYARLAEERSAFDFGSVVEAITTKLIRRHPHVFGAADARSADNVKVLWEAVKAEEKAERRASSGGSGGAEDAAESVLAGVPTALPALTRAFKLQEKASRVGFDWNDPKLVLDKIREEVEEVAEALEGQGGAAVEDEIGDLFFALANLARHVRADPESLVRKANRKFERRFGFVETSLRATGRGPAQASLDEMEALWAKAKAGERGPG
jgi:ATP diphosphatase